MKMQKIKATTIVVLFICLGLAPILRGDMPTNPTAEQASNQAKSASPGGQPPQFLKNELYLFVQSVTVANIKKNIQQPGTYLLTLQNVSPYVTCFSERPVRKTALVPIHKMLKLWQIEAADGFKANPPNADINAIIEASGQEPVNFAVQMSNPVYNQELKELTYIIKPLPGNTVALPDSGKLQHVNLFIDDICIECWQP